MFMWCTLLMLKHSEIQIYASKKTNLPMQVKRSGNDSVFYF